MEKWKRELQEVARPEKIAVLSRFFKTGPGEYGEGDVFIGVVVPDNRRISKRYYNAPVESIVGMANSEVHEHRLGGFLALVERYRKAHSQAERDEVVSLYVSLAYRANNWDLVDLSAPYIVGREWADGRHLDLLDIFSDSNMLWHKRIAVVGMLSVIRCGNLTLPCEVVTRHLSHPHPLMQKATGWILRELGKKDEKMMIMFLEAHITDLSATTLSYAVERLPKEERTRLRMMRKATQSSSRY